MNPNPEKINISPAAPQEVVENTNLENTDKIPMNIRDLRDPSERSFDLEKFINVIVRLHSEDLYKMSREFVYSEYGKYMSLFASSESDNWDEAIKKAIALEIIATTPPNRGHDFLKGRTDVEVRILMSAEEGRVFTFKFRDGKYNQGGWKDVHFQKRLGDKTPDDFTLESVPKPKELE